LAASALAPLIGSDEQAEYARTRGDAQVAHVCAALAMAAKSD